MMRRRFKGTLWGLLIVCPALLFMLATAAVPAELVHFKELLSFLDLKMPGWEIVDKPGGETLKQQAIQMSQVKAAFRAGDKTMEIQIMDCAGRGMPWLGMIPQMEIESSEEIMRPIVIDGFKAAETYQFKEKNGALNINVADRFWVRLEGHGIDNIDPLKTAAQQMDLKKLAALAK